MAPQSAVIVGANNVTILKRSLEDNWATLFPVASKTVRKFPSLPQTNKLIYDTSICTQKSPQYIKALGWVGGGDALRFPLSVLLNVATALIYLSVNHVV